MPRPILFDPVDSPYLVPFDGSFKLRKFQTDPSDNPGKEANVAGLEHAIGKLSKLQERLYAHDRYSVLLIFQAMDAAGKDGVIKHVMLGLNPQGCQVFSFKVPSDEELDHDFMWRTTRCLPERGRIGIFNRSYYEEVLVARVHSAILEAQKLPPQRVNKDIWAERYRDIRAYERYLNANGVIVRKFFLNVSRGEQKKRFLERIDTPEKNWKLSTADVRERGYWDDYMNAFEEIFRHTSTHWAPWYIVPVWRNISSNAFM
jgi:PPK2 family polyphosphate:nucleotide phosphotransferase